MPSCCVKALLRRTDGILTNIFHYAAASHYLAISIVQTAKIGHDTDDDDNDDGGGGGDQMMKHHTIS